MSFCFVLQRHLRADKVRFVVNQYSEMVGYTRSDTLAVIRGYTSAVVRVVFTDYQPLVAETLRDFLKESLHEKIRAY